MSGANESDSSRERPRPTDPAVIELIDSACDRFETEWRAGKKPRLEAFLSEVASPLRSPLFAAILPVELELRHKAGEMPDASSYRARFPKFDAAITTAFQHRVDLSRTLDRPSNGGHPTECQTLRRCPRN